jgi:hypothetical protein
VRKRKVIIHLIIYIRAREREIKREGRCQEIKQYGKLQLEGCGSFCQQGKSFFLTGEKVFPGKEKNYRGDDK